MLYFVCFTNIRFCCKRKVRLLNSIASLSCQNPPEQNLMTNSSSYCIWNWGRQTVIETGSCGVQGTFLWGKHQGCFCSCGSRRAHLRMPAARHIHWGEKRAVKDESSQEHIHLGWGAGRDRTHRGISLQQPTVFPHSPSLETQKEVALKHQGRVSL